MSKCSRNRSELLRPAQRKVSDTFPEDVPIVPDELDAVEAFLMREINEMLSSKPGSAPSSQVQRSAATGELEQHKRAEPGASA